MANEKRIDIYSEALKRMSTLINEAPRADAALYQNTTNKFGTSSDSIGMITVQRPGLDDRDYNDTINRYDWLANRIVELYPREATRKGWTLLCDDPELKKYYKGKNDELGAQRKFKRALAYGRLYGDALIVMGIDDGQTPDKPLNIKNIKSVKFLNVIDRWQLRVEQTYSDPFSPKYGEPEIYSIAAYLGTGDKRTVSWDKARVHETRTLRFSGVELTDYERIRNSGWNGSVIEKIKEGLKDFAVTVHSAAVLTQDFIWKVLSVPDLAEKIANKEENDLYNRIAFMLKNLSSVGVVLTGEGEEVQKISTSVAGLVDILDRFLDITSSMADIPRTVLFGQQLGVLAGASEQTRMWYDKVADYWRENLQSPVEYFTKILLCDQSNPSTKGEEPETWTVQMNNLWEPTAKEQAEMRKMVADADAIYLDRQVVTPEEVTASRFTEEGYSVETVIDWEARKKFEKEQDKQTPPDDGSDDTTAEDDPAGADNQGGNKGNAGTNS